MANEIRNAWQSAAAPSDINLFTGIASGDLWISEELSAAAATDTYPAVQVWMDLDWSATPTAGDMIEVFILEPDEHGTEIVPGNVTVSANDATLTTDATVHAVKDAADVVKRVVMRGTTYTNNIKFSFKYYDVAPKWILAVGPTTASVTLAAAAIHYRFFEPKGQ